MKLFLRGSCVCIIVSIWVSGVHLSLAYGGARAQSGSRPQVRPKATGPQRSGAGESGNIKVSDAGASPVARMCQEGSKLFGDRIYFNEIADGFSGDDAAPETIWHDGCTIKTRGLNWRG